MTRIPRQLGIVLLAAGLVACAGQPVPPSDALDKPVTGNRLPAARDRTVWQKQEPQQPQEPERSPAQIQAEIDEKAPLDMSRNVLFAYRSIEIPPEAEPVLAGVAKTLRADKRRYVTLVAQADYLGSKEFGVAIADQRAKVVERALVKYGVRPAQIRKRLLGTEMTQDLRCSSEACRERLRRVELILSESPRR